jgi:hypothetical protein
LQLAAVASSVWISRSRDGYLLNPHFAWS